MERSGACYEKLTLDAVPACLVFDYFHSNRYLVKFRHSQTDVRETVDAAAHVDSIHISWASLPGNCKLYEALLPQRHPGDSRESLRKPETISASQMSGRMKDIHRMYHRNSVHEGEYVYRFVAFQTSYSYCSVDVGWMGCILQGTARQRREESAPYGRHGRRPPT